MATTRATDREVYAYVSADAAHEVVAEAVPVDRASVSWAVLERPRGSVDENEWLRSERVARRPDVPLLVADLESRLAAVGAYERVQAPDNRTGPVRATSGALDMRAHAAAIPGAEDAFIEYFHFHRDADTSRLVLALPRFHANESDRFILANFSFPTDRPQDGEVKVVHPRLPPATVVSQVADSHITLLRQGYQKLFEPRDYERALGRDWKQAATEVLSAAAGALFTRRKPEPEAAPPGDPLARDAREALDSHAYRVTRDALLPPLARERVAREGELGIGRIVRELRRQASYRDQVGISMLEAGLLVEHGFRTGRMALVREHAPRLLRLSREVARAL